MRKLGFQIGAILIVVIAIKWPWEKSLQTSYEQLKLGGATLSVELRSKLSQNLAVALLSGFRGIVADFVWLGAHGSWEEEKWYRMKEEIELAVVLQPHSIPFWDIGAWHMAWNASHGENVNPKYPSDAYRIKMQREWIRAGKMFLEESIKNNPDNSDLYFQLGWLIYQKLEDPLGAVPYFIKSTSYPDAPPYVSRMVGHMYEKGGKLQEAYQWWKRLWAQNHKKTPGQLWYKIAQWGHEAEVKLNIPTTERVFPSNPKSIRMKSLE